MSELSHSASFSAWKAVFHIDSEKRENIYKVHTSSLQRWLLFLFVNFLYYGNLLTLLCKI